jgi:hypothetical protein
LFGGFVGRKFCIAFFNYPLRWMAQERVHFA